MDLLKKNNILNKEDEEIYYFGIYQTIVFIINSLTSLIIFLAFNKIIEGLTFSILYYLLRCYGGGYHSKSILCCYVLSSFLIVMVLNIILYIKINSFIILLGILSFILVFLISPVETQTKKLDSIEKKVYRKKVRGILILALFIIIILQLIDYEKGIICIILSLIIESIMQIFGTIDNMYKYSFLQNSRIIK